MTEVVSAKLYRLVVLALLLGVLSVAAVVPAAAHAEGWFENFCATTNLPAKSVCHGAIEGPLFAITGERNAGAGAVCVGPYAGGGYPYGFECGNPILTWNFTTINAHPTVDNPNSKAIGVNNLAYCH